MEENYSDVAKIADELAVVVNELQSKATAIGGDTPAELLDKLTKLQNEFEKTKTQSVDFKDETSKVKIQINERVEELKKAQADLVQTEADIEVLRNTIKKGGSASEEAQRLAKERLQRMEELSSKRTEADSEIIQQLTRELENLKDNLSDLLGGEFYKAKEEIKSKLDEK